MTTCLRNGLVYTSKGFVKKDLFVSPKDVSFVNNSSTSRIIDCTGKVILPGFVDVHVHLREPGFFYKETIKSGTKAAAKGGYTTVCSMPNVKPSPVDLETLKVQLDIIQKDAVINVIPYGRISNHLNEDLADLENMAPYVCGYSDDGKGVQNQTLMIEAMEKAKQLNKLIVAHCEDESLVNNGYIHDGEYAKIHHHQGIPSISEWIQVKRDIELVKQTGCKYHVCHVSSKESVDLIRKAKKEGVDISCETAAHYLLLTDLDLKEEGRFKMNPPLRSEEDKLALIEGIKDGTVDMIASDHAPHSEEEKNKGLKNSLFGIVGLETTFSLLYTYLVKTNLISLEKLVEIMAINPAKRFNLDGGYIAEGSKPNLVIVDLNEEETIDSQKFVSQGKATPFDGYKVNGIINKTIYQGEVVYDKDNA
ncbi:MAG: dihydroorotase [Bacilli bacterium]|nr:dihydroorotase [Bacilli bacterium]